MMTTVWRACSMPMAIEQSPTTKTHDCGSRDLPTLWRNS